MRNLTQIFRQCEVEDDKSEPGTVIKYSQGTCLVKAIKTLFCWYFKEKRVEKRKKIGLMPCRTQITPI